MQTFSAICVLTVLSIWFASGQDHHEDYDAPVHYKYEFGVNDGHTGDKKWHYEVRDGQLVKGAYTIADPDGTKRIVEYTAGPRTGFNAVVKRLGRARHPQYYSNYYHGPEEAYSEIGNTKFDYHSNSY